MNKSFYIIIFFIILAIFLIFHFGGRLGKGKYYEYDDGISRIKSKDYEYSMIGEVVEVDYNDNYIIAKRIPEFYFICGDSSSSRYIDKIQYILIDKKNDKIYGSYDRQKFFNFVRKHDKVLFFHEHSNQRIQSKILFYERNDKIIEGYKEYLNSNSFCKDSFEENQLNNSIVEIE